MLSEHDLKGKRQQRVTRERCHAGAVDLVVCQLAAAVVIVVHSRQVIVNQRIRMDHFDGAARRDEPRAISADSICRRHEQDGAQAFPTGEQTI